MKKNVTIVTPSYREFKTIPVLIKKIRKVNRDCEIIIVDDSSRNENLMLKTLLKKEKNVEVISRFKKLGRGSAVLTGLKEAFRNKTTDYFFEMDSDLAHNPSQIPLFLDKIKNYDVVIGSRYIKGGKIFKVSFSRRILSNLINRFLRIWLLVKISDFTGGFRLYNRKAVEFLINNKFESYGFITLSETIFKLNKNKYRIGEVPITITEKESGSSNVTLKELFTSLVFILKMRIKDFFTNEKFVKILFLLLIIFFAFIVRIATINQMGRTWDEPEYIDQGYKMTELIKKGDFSNSFFYLTYDHPPLAKYLYGIPAHFDVKKVAKDGTPLFKYDYTYSRLLSIIFSCIAVLFVFLIGWEFISPFVGIVSGIIFSTLPFFVGLSQLVTTESLLMLFFTSGIYFFLKLIKSWSLKNIISVGIIFGLALETKQSDILMLPIFFLIYLLWFFQQKKYKNLRFINKRLLSILLIALIGIFVFIVLWPMPYFHLKEIGAINQRIWGVKTSPPEVFFGRLILAPVVYYPVLFAITTPFLIFTFFIIGLKVIDVKKNWIFYSILAWFLFPFIQSFYPWRQHGVRYIIEIYAPLSLISALGFTFIVKKISKKMLVKSVLVIFLALYALTTLFKIKPYYLDYYNVLVGGTNGVYEKRLFHLGWWGQGLGEAGSYLQKTAPKGSKIGVAVSPITSFPSLRGVSVLQYSDNDKYDYVVVNYFHVLREGFDDNLIKLNYKLVHQVLADKVSLVDIYKKK